MENRPSFFVIGAAKSATTSLWEYIRQHPRIFMPAEKEPSFFGEFRDPSRPVRTLSQYLALFGDGAGRKRLGEASATYLYSPEAAEQIYRFNPDARIIAVLRNPVERAYSHYWHHRRTGVETLSFEEALDSEPRRIKEELLNFGVHYVNMGLYARQLQRYLDRFEADRIRVYLFEDIKSDPDSLCRDIFKFLDIEQDVKIDTGKVANQGSMPRTQLLANLCDNASILRPVVRRLVPRAVRQYLHSAILAVNAMPGTPPMREETRVRLRKVFHDDILRLQTMIARDLSHWLETPHEAAALPIRPRANRFIRCHS